MTCVMKFTSCFSGGARSGALVSGTHDNQPLPQLETGFNYPFKQTLYVGGGEYKSSPLKLGTRPIPGKIPVTTSMQQGGFNISTRH